MGDCTSKPSASAAAGGSSTSLSSTAASAPTRSSTGKGAGAPSPIKSAAAEKATPPQSAADGGGGAQSTSTSTKPKQEEGGNNADDAASPSPSPSPAEDKAAERSMGPEQQPESSSSSSSPPSGDGVDKKEDDDARLALILQRIHMIAEGINPTKESTSHAKDLAKIKDALLHVVENRKVGRGEIAKAESICEFMILDGMEDCLNLWFGKSQETDDRIWSDFSEDVTIASAGMYEHWSYAVEEPRMIVALVILLDQFRRNMFRGTKGMYTCDKMCAAYVKRAMAAGMAEQLEPKEMIFLLLNLTHSEDVEDQHMCYDNYLKLEKKLAPNDALRVFRDIFKRHVDVIEKYNRFPHRNDIYGRKSSPEEEEFLNDASFRFDLPVRKTADGGFTFFRDGKVLWKTAKSKYRESTGPKLLQVVREAQKSYKNLYDPNGDAGDGADGDDVGVSESKFYYDDPDAHAMAIEQQSYVRIGDEAPNFTAKSTRGLIKFHEYLGDSWGVLFSHPKDFTPVCTTELGRAAQLQREFDGMNVKLCAVSVDLLKDHGEWMKDIQEVSGAALEYPLIEDKHRKISMAYGMLDQTSFDLKAKAGVSITVRSVFVINPKKRVSLILTYPVPVGRNFAEILRAIRALQTNWEYGVATPVDWDRGKPTVVLPFYSDDEAISKFKEIDKKTSYLRYTPDPGAAAKAEDEDGAEAEIVSPSPDDDDDDDDAAEEEGPAAADDEGVEVTNKEN